MKFLLMNSLFIIFLMSFTKVRKTVYKITMISIFLLGNFQKKFAY